MPALPLWKLVRNPYGRAVYDALDALGIKFSKMHLYAADLDDIPSASPPADVTFAVRSPDEITPPPSQDADPLVADDEVIVALSNQSSSKSNTEDSLSGETGGDDQTSAVGDQTAIVGSDQTAIVGYQTLSLDRAVYVPPVEREMDHDAFLWGLYVEPDHRNRGIATALVAEALRVARERGCEQAHSLVAVDNAPSQRALATNGFEPIREVSYYRLFGLERRVDRPI